MGLEIIGAGFGRTGTLSLRLALEHLGFGPCYHMFQLVDHHPDHNERFLEAARGEPVDWEELFQGYRSTVDWPAAAFWSELTETYPEAKVILSVRDPDSWFDSAWRTILPEISKPPLPGEEAHRRMTHKIILEDTFSGNADDREAVKRVFLEHIETVRSSVPPEQLLVYELGAGWEPLCSFLNCATPHIPFPRTNSSAEFEANVTKPREKRRRQALTSSNKDSDTPE